MTNIWLNSQVCALWIQQNRPTNVWILAPGYQKIGMVHLILLQPVVSQLASPLVHAPANFVPFKTLTVERQSAHSGGYCLNEVLDSSGVIASHARPFL